MFQVVRLQTIVEPSFVVQTPGSSSYFVLFLAIIAHVVPLWQLGSKQQICKQGDTQSFTFTHHTLGGVYRASLSNLQGRGHGGFITVQTNPLLETGRLVIAVVAAATYSLRSLLYSQFFL